MQDGGIATQKSIAIFWDTENHIGMPFTMCWDRVKSKELPLNAIKNRVTCKIFTVLKLHIILWYPKKNLKS